MARIKAIFDTDILIHLLKTDALQFAIDTLQVIYISEYVYTTEITKGTKEEREVTKLINKGNIKILEYRGLTPSQKNVYNETYKQLKKEDISDDPSQNPINEGERVTACFAKACNIYYYMSDDNKAAPYIRSLVAVETVNYCDILFMYLIAFGEQHLQNLEITYKKYIGLYDKDKIPRVIKNEGKVFDFIECMGHIYSKFQGNKNLTQLLESVKSNTSNNK